MTAPLTTRERIVEVAVAMTTQSGWSGVTMAAVAERAGVSRQTVYNELGSKEGLAEAVILRELERFIVAMRSIRDEIDEVASGAVALEDSVLRHAPHTAEVVMADDWTRAYPRSRAAFPVEDLRRDKYWPPVGRVDNAVGDRNPICACPPMTEYQDLVEA